MNIKICSKSSSYKYHKRMKKCYYRSYLHFFCLDFVTHKFRSTSYHQSTYEYCYNNECKVVHPTYTNTTKPCINLHIQHFNHAGQRHCRIVHTVYRTIRRNSCNNTPKTCCAGTETNLLTFHCSIVLCYTHCVNSWVTPHLLRYIDAYTY